MQIPLTQGQITTVDDSDFEWLSQWKWHAKWAAHIKSFYASHAFNVGDKFKSIPMHRFLLNAKPGFQVDHINRDTLDNRRTNLRLCANGQNQHNARKHEFKKGHGASSKYKGVTWRSKTGCWFSQIQVDKKKIGLGFFNDELSAARAYDRAALNLFGEFARTNFDLEIIEKFKDDDAKRKRYKTSQYVGVGISNLKSKPWRARIAGKIWYFKTEIEAAEFYINSTTQGSADTT